MPGMSGRELTGYLTERYPGLKTIFISGYADDILEPQGLLAVKAHLLRKPCTPDDAARLIRHALDGTVGDGQLGKHSWSPTAPTRSLNLPRHAESATCPRSSSSSSLTISRWYAHVRAPILFPGSQICT